MTEASSLSALLWSLTPHLITAYFLKDDPFFSGTREKGDVGFSEHIHIIRKL